MAVIPKENLSRIRRFYYDNLKSAKDIAEELGVSVDAVYYFMRRNELKRRTLSEDNKVRFLRKPPSFRLKRSLNSREKYLELAGLMLYWSEGAKTGSGSAIDFANSDPQMIKVFMKFLREIFGVQEKRIRVLLYCYADQNINELINFWSKVAGVSRRQFTKPYVRKDFRKEGRKMLYGLVHVRYSDKKLLSVILDLIEDHKNAIIRN